MTTSEAQISFEMADYAHLDYIAEKTIALHHFETASSDNQKILSSDFEQHIKDWLSAELGLKNTLIFRVFLNQNLIGFAHIKVLPSPNKFTKFDTYGYIQSLWLEPEFRGKSLGEQIVVFIESVFKEQQVGYYEVNTSASNQLAQDFWKTIGMETYSINFRKML